MAKMKCGKPVRGVKTCRVGAKTFKLRDKLTGARKRAKLPRALLGAKFTSAARYVCDRDAKGHFKKPCRPKGDIVSRVKKAQLAYHGGKGEARASMFGL